MSGLQDVPSDTESVAAPMDSAEAKSSGNGQESNYAGGPKFKRIKPEELAMLSKFIELLPDKNVNSSIEFSELPHELKRLVLPTSDARLVERNLVELTYSEDNGAILTVSISPLAYAGYNRLMEEESAGAVSTKPTGIRGSRGEFSDHKYKLHKMVDTNPHREGTRRWYTWEMYSNGDSMDQVRVKPYDRNIKLYTGKWFNGPDRAVIELDIKQGFLWVYDSTENEKLPDGSDNPKFWVSRNQTVASTDPEESLDDQEVSAEA